MRDQKPRKGDKQPEHIEGDPTDPQGMAVMLGAYLESLRMRNYSEQTIIKRRAQVNDFIRWAAERSLVRPSEITRPILERYQRHLFCRHDRHDRPLSFRNQHSRLSSLRSWFKYLARGRYVLHNPASELELPKLGHRLPKHVLSQQEAEEILSQTDLAEPLGIRDRAILETFYSTGIRRQELVNLDVYDVDADRGVVMIRQGKGKKDRVIPIGSRALAWTEKYRLEIRPRLLIDPAEQALYLTRMGERFSGAGMSLLVREYVNSAETGKTGSCHLFRHTMATLMLEGGADLRFIQAMLGHAKLDTTQIYTQVSIRKLKEIHEATHPAKLSREPSAERPEPAGEAGSESIE